MKLWWSVHAHFMDQAREKHTHHFHSHPTGQSSMTWPHHLARAIGKFSFQLGSSSPTQSQCKKVDSGYCWQLSVFPTQGKGKCSSILTVLQTSHCHSLFLKLETGIQRWGNVPCSEHWDLHLVLASSQAYFSSSILCWVLHIVGSQ